MNAAASSSSISTQATEQTAHTPGPWLIERGADGCPLISTGRRPGSYTETVALVQLHSTHVRMAGVRITPAQTHANARLIAAAPDMLKALQAAHEAMGWYGVDDFEYAGQRVGDQVRVAIAMATGTPSRTEERTKEPQRD